MTKDELVSQYKLVHKEKTGIELSDEEAYAQAINLVTLVKAVYQKSTTLQENKK